VHVLTTVEIPGVWIGRGAHEASAVA
jgi:hypothetical protein